jgi:agmatinase
MPFFDGEIPDIPFGQAGAVIMPVPYEQSTSYGKGTANGPAAILEAGPFLEYYDDEFDCEPWRFGVHVVPPADSPADPDEFQDRLTQKTAGLLENKKFVIALGGEHAVSFGLYRAFHDHFQDLSVLQLDAHSDLRKSYQENKWSHASVMRRIYELNRNIVMAGIRSQCREERDFIVENSIPVFYAHQIRNTGLGRQIIDRLKRNVYLTIDVDFFDPSVMPSTGTPEPGGFLWDETISFLAALFRSRNVVGVDLVELSPVPGVSHPNFMAAKLVYKLIGLKYLQESHTG